MIDLRIGDSRQLIHGLENKSIDCVVTSPPYWALRDYKTAPIIFDELLGCEHEWIEHIQKPKGGMPTESTTIGANKNGEANNRGHNTITNFCSKCGAWQGQLGLEPTPELFIKHLLDFFDNVRLKLKDEGNVFVNLGDTYNGSGNGNNFIDPKNKDRDLTNQKPEPTHYSGIPKKCLCMIPSRFAWGMIERGWILRNEIIWSKPNHMPESVTDRLAKAHEVIYHFVKQQKYYYDLDAIREPLSSSSIERISQKTVFDQTGGLKQELLRGNPDNGNASRCNKMVQSLAKKYKGKFEGDNNPEAFGSPRARTQRKHQIGDGYRQGMNRDESDVSIQRVHEVNQKEIAEFLKDNLTDDLENELDERFGVHKWRHWIRTDESGASLPSPDDWKKLHEVAPWMLDTFDEIMLTVKEVPQVVAANAKGKNPGDVWDITTQPYPESHFAVFPLELVRRPILAGCPPDGWVLDPFAGSGTVGEFCRHNDRNAVLFELNPDYKKLIENRVMLNIPELSKWCTTKEHHHA